MSAPKCRLCGACHWTTEDHVFPDTVSRATPQAVKQEAKKPARQREAGVSNAVSNGAAERVRKWREKGPNRDAYNAQQRERMRVRRAARRNQAGAT